LGAPSRWLLAMACGQRGGYPLGRVTRAGTIQVDQKKKKKKKKKNANKKGGGGAAAARE